MDQRRKIAVVLGPDGTFSSIAAGKLAPNFRLKFVSSFAALFRSVKGDTYGLVPVHNKIIGKIPRVEKFFKKGKWNVIDKAKIYVQFILAAQKGVKISSIRTVYVPVVVRNQCKKFIGNSLKQVRNFKSSLSSSSSFKKIVQLKEKMAGQSAVIGSIKSAKLHGLSVLARNIQDDPHGWTEFILFSAAGPASQAVGRRRFRFGRKVDTRLQKKRL